MSVTQAFFPDRAILFCEAGVEIIDAERFRPRQFKAEFLAGFDSPCCPMPVFRRSGGGGQAVFEFAGDGSASRVDDAQLGCLRVPGRKDVDRIAGFQTDRQRGIAAEDPDRNRFDRAL